ncbi:glycosyltransferase [Bacillota bacterium Lsc_1132]
MIMNNGEKILILSGRFGEGHLQAAKAIQEAAKLKYPEVQTMVVDFMEWAHPNLFPVSHFVYMKGIKTFPQLYGFFYQKTYKSSSFSKKLNDAFSLGMRKMLHLLAAYKPSVVVSTYPFASSVLSKLKENGLTNVPLVTVITDHTHHSYWLHPYTDQYMVGSKQIKEKLIRLGIQAKKIATTGIPIRTTFLEKSDKQAVMEKYQLEKSKPTILIMGGGEGLIGKGMLDPKTLEQFPQPLQLLVLCGHNEKLREQLLSELACSKHSIKLLGYIERVDELMAVSDMIITKPGGVTTSEALAMELPMLLYKPLPGQEQDNARFLTASGAAVIAQNPTELYALLADMIENKPLLAKMKENCGKIQKSQAAFHAVTIIAGLLNSRIFVVSADSIQQRKFKPFRLLRKTLMHG